MTHRLFIYCAFSIYLIIALVINAWQHNVAWTIATGFLVVANLIFDYLYFKDVLVKNVHEVNIKGLK